MWLADDDADAALGIMNVTTYTKGMTVTAFLFRDIEKREWVAESL